MTLTLRSGTNATESWINKKSLTFFQNSSVIIPFYCYNEELRDPRQGEILIKHTVVYVREVQGEEVQQG